MDALETALADKAEYEPVTEEEDPMGEMLPREIAPERALVFPQPKGWIVTNEIIADD